MKKSLFLIAALAFAAIASAQTLFVGTYNIRYKNDGDSIKGNVWSVRSKVIADQINFYEPDIFQLQRCNSIFLDEAGCADIAKFLYVIKYKITAA